MKAPQELQAVIDAHPHTHTPTHRHTATPTHPPNARTHAHTHTIDVTNGQQPRQQAAIKEAGLH